MSATEHFSKVIGMDLKDTNTVIDWLSEEGQLQGNRQMRLADPVYYFTDLVNNQLEEIMFESEYDPATHQTHTIIKRGITRVNVLMEMIGKGSFGTTFLTYGGFVYKRIYLDSTAMGAMELEATLRGIYLEIFIQTVVANDPDVGKYICKPLKLFKSTSNAGSIIMFIQMEHVQYKFAEHLDIMVTYTKKPTLDIEDLYSVLKPLATTLSVLRKRYGFYHCDLHTGNVMLSNTGDIKLIDFGFSCMDYEGVLYRPVRAFETAPSDCMSFDLLIFLVHLIERHGQYFSKSGMCALRRFLTNGPGTPDLYKMLQKKADADGSFVFHKTYMSFLKKDPVLVDYAINLPMLDPDAMQNVEVFLKKMKKQISECTTKSGGGGRTRRQKMYRRRTRRMKKNERLRF